VQEVQQEDEAEFRGMFRMNVESFQYLLRLVEPVIAKQDTRTGESVSAREPLQITLRYLATGDNITLIIIDRSAYVY